MPMSETERLSALIGNIYDAALDPALWPDVLREMASFVGGQAAGLLSKDSVSKIGIATYHAGVDPHYLRLYAETYCKFDPMAALHFFEVEQVVSIPELVAFDEFRQGRFYREWVKPQGWLDAANTVLDKSVTSYAYLSIIRDEAAGMVDDEMRRHMRLVVPHVRRAVLIGRAIDLKTAEVASLADTLDGLSAGMFLIDATGRIVHANVAGHGILRANDYLRAAGGRLLANDPHVNGTLRDIFSAVGGGDAALGSKGIAVPLVARDGTLHVAHVLPLTSGARRRAHMAYAAVAALFVHRAALETPSPPEAIAKTYRLTPTELRVLLAVVEVGGVPEVAEALGVSTETVKTHLGRVYAKTGAHRQADLVKLVAGFSSPLAG
jgi:DNA-binding CsgD family transcriptional regulator